MNQANEPLTPHLVVAVANDIEPLPPGHNPATHINKNCFLVSNLGTGAYDSCKLCTLKLRRCLQFRGQVASAVILTLIGCATLLPIPPWVRALLGLAAAAALLRLQSDVAKESHRLIKAHYNLQLQKSRVDTLVVRRTAKLAEAKTQLESNLKRLTAAQKRLVVTSRRAGMAEVANGVLHNIGNLLNSVNVSVDLLSERVRHSKIAGLAKVVALLSEHEHDLARFVSENPGGRTLLPYLSALQGHLESDNKQLKAEIGCAREAVDYIRDIISKQQAHAGPAAPTAPENLSALIDDSLALAHGVFTVGDIEIERHEEPLEVLVDRHVVVQVIVNLLTNACEAFCSSPERIRRILIEAGRADGRFFFIRVTDQGMGIAEENMASIFQYGFTTKDGGNGFGLHDSSNAARAHGGALTCASDGEGFGASFTMTLPLSPCKD
ncbi:MAG: C4-dicarboxylate-specific signal transduction histidine kinase [Myxococcota bacterium]|jgi:C4-dicarboxylate-specific signal transduction histidine kinase